MINLNEYAVQSAFKFDCQKKKMNLINYDYHLQFYNMKQRSGLNETNRFQKLRGQEPFYPQET